MKKVMIFEQAELPYVYGVCGLDHTHGNPKTGFLCEGNRPIDDFEKDTIKNMEVGEVFWTKAEFGVDLVIANGNERINDSNMSLFGNVDEEHSFNKILDENLQRLFTADEFVDIVLDYQMSFLNDDTLEFEYDGENSDEIKAQWCSNNRDIDEGNDECYYDGKIVWHTVYMKNTVCEDCVKTEFMWKKIKLNK